MTGIRPEICLAIKQARRAAKLSQQELAAEVGCKQSALSMFEQGDPTKLNDEVVEKLARKFKVDLHAVPPEAESAASVVSPLMPRAVAHSAYCPNPNCPTNHRYEVEGRVFALPDRDGADPVGGRFCAMCGESLNRVCPNCGAPVHPGAICSLCGEPYVVI